MNSYLLEHKNRVRDSEQATKDYCIRPILRGLGWDPESPTEVEPERRISQGYRRADLKVDFALLINNSPVIYVEAKRQGRDFDPEWEKQLKRYTGDLSSGYGVLTDGRMWLIEQVGQGRDQLLATVDLLEGTSNAATVLNDYLSKSHFEAAPTASPKVSGTPTAWPTPETRRAASRQPSPPPAPRQASDEELRERLRDYRNRISRRYGIPAYTVFSNSALENIVAVRPRNAQQLSSVSGIGPKTLNVHGKAILTIVNDD